MMVKQHVVPGILGIFVVLLALAACEGSAAAPSAAPVSRTSTPVPGGTLVATSIAPVNPSPPPMPTPTPPGFAPPTFEPLISVPPELHLSGKLIFADFRVGIAQLDFSTGEIAPIYRPPATGYVGATKLSPDGQTYLLIYSPPPDPNNANAVASGLYTLPADNPDEPALLLHDPGVGNGYSSLGWSPGGQSVYFVRYVNPPLPGTPTSGPDGYILSRYPLPDGPAQDLLTDVLAAAYSADGKALYYVSINAATMSNLYTADPDGANPRSLLPGGDDWIVDTLALAPDGTQIVFSSASNFSSAQESSPQYGLSLLDQLMGVQVAEAHNLPSDLWSLTPGRSPQQLTDLVSYGFLEDFSPDGQYIVFSCGKGTYVMRPDGSEQTRIMSEPVYGSLQWIP